MALIRCKCKGIKTFFQPLSVKQRWVWGISPNPSVLSPPFKETSLLVLLDFADNPAVVVRDVPRSVVVGPVPFFRGNPARPIFLPDIGFVSGPDDHLAQGLFSA